MFHTCSESKASHHKMEYLRSTSNHQVSAIIVSTSHQSDTSDIMWASLCSLPPAPADKTVLRHLEVDFQFCEQQQQSVYCPSCLRQDWRYVILTITLVTSSSSSWQQQWIFATIQCLWEEEAYQNPVITRPSLSASSQNPDIIRDNMGCAPLAPADKLQ